MAFHFALDAVLRLHHGQERMERLRLDAILSELAQARLLLDEINQISSESRRLFQRQMGETLTGAEIQFESQRVEGIKAARLSLQTRHSELEQRRTAQTQTYLQARQRREILENLRQRKLDLYRIEQSRREQQGLDDLFLMRLESPADE
jgi:flagellar export protein FliJ